MIQQLKNQAHLVLALLANIHSRFPAKKMIVIGVTGTDGKTTTVNLIYHILQNAGKKVAMVSTVGAKIGNQTYDVGLHVTTPSPFKLQQYIKKALDSGSVYLVLEVTSHGIDQNRIFGVPFQIGVITNVTREHLDYHKTYDNYLKTKAKLLLHAKTAIINKDDVSFEKLSQLLKNEYKQFLTYGLHNTADVSPQKFHFKTHLVGEFNTYNCLAAISVARLLGVDDEVIKESLLTFTTPVGRQEIVFQNEFTVMIDFAHTPNSFHKLLKDLKQQGYQRIIHVFGSAGKRDIGKRPEMGKNSSEIADVIILTAEDPRDEPIENINKDIARGFSTHFTKIEENELKPNEKHVFLEVPDRKDAIFTAIKIAQKGDLVLITGKSHEKSMNIGGKELPWDEFKTVHSAIESIIKK